jgi:transcription elongation factor Elf1
MPNTGEKRYCAGCGKWLLIFPDQEDFYNSLKPEDRLHESCRVDRDEVLPDTWHCPNCDHPMIVQAENLHIDKQSMWTPDITWVAHVNCEHCGYSKDEHGRSGTHAAKMLYHHLRWSLLRLQKGGG